MRLLREKENKKLFKYTGPAYNSYGLISPEFTTYTHATDKSQAVKNIKNQLRKQTGDSYIHIEASYMTEVTEDNN